MANPRHLDTFWTLKGQGGLWSCHRVTSLGDVARAERAWAERFEGVAAQKRLVRKLYENEVLYEARWLSFPP